MAMVFVMIGAARSAEKEIALGVPFEVPLKDGTKAQAAILQGPNQAIYVVAANGSLRTWQLVPLVAPPPNPTPEPTPDPLSGLALLVNQWAGESVPSAGRAAIAARLADTFRNEAAKIGKDLAYKAPADIAKLVAATKDANTIVLGTERDKWAAWLEKLRVYLNAEASAGRLTTIEQHKDAWLAIEKGLRKVQ
jgi:hypothetical protein